MGSMKTVVVAENDDDARQLVVATVRSLGFHVLEAASGDELLLLANELLDDAQPIELVLSDIGMPGCDGIEATRRLLVRAPSLPVVLMTAFSDARVFEHAREAGACQLLRKPFSRLALQEAIAACAANP